MWAALRDPSLKPAERQVLGALILRADGRGESWPTQATMAEDLSLPVKTVEEAVRGLRRRQWLQTRRQGPRRTVYRVCPPEPVESL